MTNDNLIDRLLFCDWGGGASVKDILGILNFDTNESETIYEALLQSKLFEPDHYCHDKDCLRLSTFGKKVKVDGGWITYKKKIQAQQEREQLEISQLRVNIFKVKYWWFILVISAIISALFSIGLPLLLKQLGIVL